MTPDPNKREAMKPQYWQTTEDFPKVGSLWLRGKGDYREHMIIGYANSVAFITASCGCEPILRSSHIQDWRLENMEWSENRRDWFDCTIQESDTRAPERDAEVAVMNCAFDPESVEFTPAEWLALNTQKADRITELERELASVTAEKKAETKAVLDCTRAMRLMQDEIASVTKERDQAREALGLANIKISTLRSEIALGDTEFAGMQKDKEQAESELAKLKGIA